MTTQTICKDCGQELTQELEKAVGDGTWAEVWYGKTDWVCLVTGNEHQPGDYAGEHDAWGNPVCGQDFMAGTICSDEPGHEGPHSCVCQNCGGDWMNETCDCYVSPLEALTLGIFALNTWLAPDASSDEDLAVLNAKAEAAVAALARLREFVIAAGEDLPDYVFEEDDES